jgi:hypothetical protein
MISTRKTLQEPVMPAEKYWLPIAGIVDGIHVPSAGKPMQM